ncbi:hypothetical protein N658DRAFT_169653 [Parathielavia hyrcaniae]|uniref:Uncharacterized protein n=1 Tax=Parathielavia hyrcaniae TaxID=113614 RepID=A0AAN6SZN8_9PEZI|nr:hypothetical protein N658DRAFT_169653 [Parathielavia hyrcaniae]
MGLMPARKTGLMRLITKPRLAGTGCQSSETETPIKNPTRTAGPRTLAAPRGPYQMRSWGWRKQFLLSPFEPPYHLAPTPTFSNIADVRPSGTGSRLGAQHESKHPTNTGKFSIGKLLCLIRYYCTVPTAHNRLSQSQARSGTSLGTKGGVIRMSMPGSHAHRGTPCCCARRGTIEPGSCPGSGLPEGFCTVPKRRFCPGGGKAMTSWPGARWSVSCARKVTPAVPCAPAIGPAKREKGASPGPF